MVFYDFNIVNIFDHFTKMFIVWELSLIMLNTTNPTPPTTHIPLGLSNVYCMGIVIDYV